MNYPSINEYKEAILFAEDNFEQLKNLRPVLDEEGNPVMTGGNFAEVFKMKDEQTGKLYAVKSRPLSIWIRSCLWIPTLGTKRSFRYC